MSPPLAAVTAAADVAAAKGAPRAGVRIIDAPMVNAADTIGFGFGGGGGGMLLTIAAVFASIPPVLADFCKASYISFTPA